MNDRFSAGKNAGIFGICCNIFLALLKAVAGVLTGAVSITADAVNNFSDAASSIVTAVGFAMAKKPADKEHPYGHGRVEYIAGLIVSLLIMVTGVELIQTSIEHIIHPEPVEFSVLVVVILVVSIGVKLFMGILNRALAQKYDSVTMKAVASDSFSDCVCTLVVLISLVVSSCWGHNLDGVMGVIVALFVIKTGIEAAVETISPLMGEEANSEIVDTIDKLVLSDENIVGVHDLRIHNYGPDKQCISVHIVLDGEMSLRAAHEIADAAEKRVEEALGAEITIHVDPKEEE